MKNVANARQILEDESVVVLVLPRHQFIAALAGVNATAVTSTIPTTTPPPEQAKKWLTVGETVDRVPFGQAKLWELLRSGQLPSVKRAGRRIIAVADLERFMAGEPGLDTA